MRFGAFFWGNLKPLFDIILGFASHPQLWVVGGKSKSRTINIPLSCDISF